MNFRKLGLFGALFVGLAGLAQAADNHTLKDAGAVTRTFRSQDNSSVWMPFHHVACANGVTAMGTAGTAASCGVFTVQGIASMTPLLVTLSGTNNVTNAGTFAVQASQAGTWNVTNAGTFAVQAAATLGAETTKVIGVVRNADGAGNLLTSATRGSERALTVQIVDGSGTQVTAFSGSGGTSSNFASTFPSAGTGIGFSDGTNMQGARVFDLDSGAGTEYGLGVSMRIAASGGSIPITAGNGAVAAGTQRVTIANDSTGIIALTTGSATIGALTANQSVNVAQMNGVTTLMGNGATGTGSQRVTIANDSTGIGIITETAPASDTASSGLNGRLQRIAQNLTTLNTTMGTDIPSVTGPLAAATAASTKALTIGAQYLSTQPTMTNTQQASLLQSARGALLVQTGTETFAVTCSNCSGSGVSAADAATFTAGTTAGALANGFFQTTATSNALTNGQQGAMQLTANRALMVNLRTAAGAEIGTSGAPVRTDPTGTTTQPANVAQINGVTPLMGNGATGTGALRVSIANDSTGIVALTTGSATIGALTANQSVNVAQINGVTTLMGAGNTGTGSQRVTIATDQAAHATAGQGATGSAAPAGATLSGVRSGANMVGLIQASAHANIAMSTATTTEIIAASGSTVIYVTGYDFISDGTGTFKFVRGTGTNCGTGTTDLGPTYRLKDGYGISRGGGLGPIMVGAASGAICVTTSAAVNINGLVSYTQF